MEKINKMIETTVYLSYDGEEFKNEHECLMYEAEQKFYDLCNSGKLLDKKLNKPHHFDYLFYIVGISEEELEDLNKSLRFMDRDEIEPTSESGNYYWAGNSYKSLESFIDIFKKESKDVSKDI